MKKIKIQHEVVYPEGIDNIRVTKDTGTFGGPNMWHLGIRQADGEWDDQIQWIGRHTAQRIVGKDLPEYPEPKSQYD